MGQQQLLFILLGIIIIGVAISLSIVLFRQNAIENKRDLLINECINLATMAQSYYKKPPNFGGGGNKFTGWKIPDNLLTTATGSFEAVVTSGSILISATGNELATGDDSIKVEVTVLPSSYSTLVIH